MLLREALEGRPKLYWPFPMQDVRDRQGNHVRDKDIAWPEGLCDRVTAAQWSMCVTVSSRNFHGNYHCDCQYFFNASTVLIE
eukprot:g49550.t1